MKTHIAQTPARSFITHAVRLIVALSAGAFTAVGTLMPASPAMATPNLMSANPAPDSQVSSLPDMYVLDWDATMNVVKSEINVYDPTGFNLNESPLTTLNGGHSLGMISHYTDRPYGTYVVTYDVESQTGERIAGSYSFEYMDPNAGGGGSEPAPAETVIVTVASSATPTVSSTVIPSPTPSMDARDVVTTTAESSNGSSLTWILGFAALGLGILCALAVIIVLLARKRKATDEHPAAPPAPPGPSGPKSPPAS